MHSLASRTASSKAAEVAGLRTDTVAQRAPPAVRAEGNAEHCPVAFQTRQELPRAEVPQLDNVPAVSQRQPSSIRTYCPTSGPTLYLPWHSPVSGSNRTGSYLATTTPCLSPPPRTTCRTPPNPKLLTRPCSANSGTTKTPRKPKTGAIPCCSTLTLPLCSSASATVDTASRAASPRTPRSINASLATSHVPGLVMPWTAVSILSQRFNSPVLPSPKPYEQQAQFLLCWRTTPGHHLHQAFQRQQQTRYVLEESDCGIRVPSTPSRAPYALSSTNAPRHTPCPTTTTSQPDAPTLAQVREPTCCATSTTHTSHIRKHPMLAPTWLPQRPPPTPTPTLALPTAMPKSPAALAPHPAAENSPARETPDAGCLLHLR